MSAVSPFPYSLGQLRDDTLYRLGDADLKIWTTTEIERWIVQGYEQFCLNTRILWGRAYPEDRVGVAVVRVPDMFHVLERATWNFRILSGIASVDIDRFDSRYQITQGEVYAYTMDKDGLRNFRKIRVPATNGSSFPVSNSAAGAPYALDGPALYGIPRRLTGVTTDSVTGSYGIPRRVPNQEAFEGLSGVGSYPYGSPRRFYQDLFNTKLEYWRRPFPLQYPSSMLEIPRQYVNDIRFFAMWKALEKEGPGQNLKLASHYKERYALAVKRCIKFREKINDNRLGRMGGPTEPRAAPPRPQLPWFYGRRVR